MILGAKLDLRIEQLEKLKTSYRTVEELSGDLAHAVAALDDAMAKKEFKRCAQLQQVGAVWCICHEALHFRQM